jgi:uncharacterized membrane protein
MTNKIKNLISAGQAKTATLVTAVVSGALVAGNAFAAVDPDVASTTQQMVSTMKENVTGVITTNISQIVIVGVIIFSLTFVWRLARKFMK